MASWVSGQPIAPTSGSVLSKQFQRPPQKPGCNHRYYPWDNPSGDERTGNPELAGVIGIVQLAGQAALAGDTSIFTLIAILSANLALMNLLPVPVLDGGAFLFCAAEWVCGRPISVKLQDFTTRAGTFAMATLFMLAMMHNLVAFGLLR